MRLLLLADTPADEPLLTLIKREQPAAVILLGDLQLSWVADLQHCALPKFGVFGNHCAPGYLATIGATLVGDTCLSLGAWTAIGVSGCRRYKSPAFLGHDFQMTDTEEVAHWRTLPSADLVLSHAPPLGINDCIDDLCPAKAASIDDAVRQECFAAVACDSDPAHVGWRGGRSYLAEKKPRFWLHGHTYPDANKWSRVVGDTIVHYVSGARIIDLADVPVHSCIPTNAPRIPAPSVPAPSWWQRLTGTRQ